MKRIKNVIWFIIINIFSILMLYSVCMVPEFGIEGYWAVFLGTVTRPQVVPLYFFTAFLILIIPVYFTYLSLKSTNLKVKTIIYLKVLCGSMILIISLLVASYHYSYESTYIIKREKYDMTISQNYYDINNNLLYRMIPIDIAGEYTEPEKNIKDINDEELISRTKIKQKAVWAIAFFIPLFISGFISYKYIKIYAIKENEDAEVK